ncbi:RIP metalloprotease RseP [Hymenobacter coalescens]
MDILVMAGQLLLALTILVGLHEAGHMLSAKWFGMRVEKFSIGFPPKVFGKQIGETEYMVGAIPLGGFVKITGMVDESLDTDALSGPPQPYEFRAKPAWQRLIVMLGGIIVNVITGIIIFALLTFKYGEEYIPASEARYGIMPNKLGEQMGFRLGDRIVKINGKPFENFDEVYAPQVLLGNGSYYTVERGAQLVDINVPTNMLDKLNDPAQRDFVVPRLPFEVRRVAPGGPAAEAGVQGGDKVVQIGEVPVQFFYELQGALKRYSGQQTTVVVQRGAERLTLPMKVTEQGKMGIEQKPLVRIGHRQYSLLESLPRGAEKAYEFISLQVQAFGKMFRREVSAVDSLGGPIEIAQQFGGADDFSWEHFWQMTGALSLALAFMNLLPIPALDGGHVVFLTYEIISGRKPSDRFMENAQKVGMLLVLSLMAFVLFKTPIKWLISKF